MAQKVVTTSDLIEQIGDLKREIKNLDGQMRPLQDKCIDQMITTGEDKAESSNWKGTLVRPESTHLDEAKLMTLLSDSQLRRVTVRQIDHDALEFEVKRGNIPIELIAECTTIVPKSPYILIKPQ